MSFAAIVSGTPVWVWILLAVLVSRGLKAMKGGTAPLSKLAIVPALFAGWGLLHVLTGPAAGAETALMWFVGGLLGTGAGVVQARASGLSVDRVRRTVTLTGSVVPLALILVTFASKFWIGVELATSASVGVDSMFVVLNGLVSGVVAGIFAGRFLIYWLALRPAAAPALDRA
ncbi:MULTISPECIES: DUF6622 family protein [unclassified Caballeronia]|uniref:DUF6622 family protein n=1 Tax=unclassified Caballeronia TaxID=2646786 RepID=UPI0028572293|nr:MULTISPECIES: DUF6622 family protein [unclassified Caballeronia]MDR5739665.1 hypothetical protein [Caballeronia sp. LZ016]MDR5808131.1 hypothetical protein [Caballeronia sp. LZ019]